MLINVRLPIAHHVIGHPELVNGDSLSVNGGA